MTPEKETRLSVLREIFPDNSFNEIKSEFVTWCPHKYGCNGGHHKKKLQINIEDNVFNCWVCSYSGFIIKLLKDEATSRQKNQYLDTIEFLDRDDADEEFDLEPPPYNSFLLNALHIPKAVRSLEWLRENCGASDELIYQLKIGYCSEGDYGGRLIFPSYSEQGRLNFYVTRDIDRSDRWKYLNCAGVKLRSFIFNEILIDWSKPVMFVEGIKAYIKHFDLSCNIIPLMGSRFNGDYRVFRKSIIEDVPKVYVALDHEAQEKALEIMELYDFFGVNARMISFSDVSQPDNLATEEMVERMGNASVFSEKDFINAKIDRIRRSL